MALATRSVMGNQPAAVSGGARSLHQGQGQGGVTSAEHGPVESANSYVGVSYGDSGSGSGFQFSGELKQGFQQDQQRRPQAQQRDPFSRFSTPSSVFASLFGLEHGAVKTDGQAAGKSPFASIVRGAVASYEKTAMVISDMKSPLGGSLSMRL